MRTEQPPVLETGVPPRQTARRAAVLGSPVGQSLTPVLHRAALAAMGLDWNYQAIECDETGLPGLLAQSTAGLAGLSLCMPLKRAVLPLIDEVSDLALDVGGANTVVYRRGRSHGDNTDVYGMLTALHEAGVSSPGTAVVLGGGSTACSALAALRELGVLEPAVVVRERSRAAEATAAAGRLGIAVDVHTFGQLDELLPGAGLVISTLPAGAADTFAAAVMHSRAAVFDVVSSAWPTRLVKAAGFAGSTVVDGLSFAVHQAARQLELMTGRSDIPIQTMRRAAQTELLHRAD
ncbi:MULTISPECIES: shikimate dehydrogenase [unclassified Kitasatospora]|uniref:shikimate dehydrogenase n=1 Tax=unclassified Kitasatospora TaxID=2633591 RepID=UPI0007102B67|nr:MULTISPECIES: shikimate dehydrogenase [unclassified Kitasatospora]KQV15430.1 shikimate dehydrogenase [Kitasatospora sp. Root107]KRB63981.1 shikimate dehydrogenase [Kitasatospora sp. Root187]